MSRKPAQTPTVIDTTNPEAFEAAASSLNELAAINAQANEAAQAIALQVGYDGTLAVGALEDGIRFYQRRTVEAILETGKRLLVLKELTPHGEFEQRMEMLGFSSRTARRFMQAAAKTAKSAILADLSKQAKNGLAFLELVTHDDDTLDDLSKLDDIDRMSASELRNVARSLRGDLDAKDKVLDDTQKRLTKLQVQSKKAIAADTDWPEALTPITDQIAAAGRSIAKAISDLETCRITLLATGQELEADLQPKYEAALGHVVEVYEAALGKAERDISKERVTFDKSLGAYGEASETGTAA